MTTVTLESLAATINALKEENQRDHERILIQLDKMNSTVHQNCEDIARLQEQQSLYHKVQATFTAVAAAIAGWVGSQK